MTHRLRMVSRREFLGWVAGVLPVAVIVRQAHAAAVAHLAASPDTLDALGGAVLPGELGSAQIARVVSGFRHWIEGYRENAEVLHGYGNSRLRFTGPTPATRWTKQLDDLDVAARAAHGAPFSAATVAQRQAILRPLLATERGSGIPGSPEGATHVALALMGFFYGSPMATDLCYEADIGPSTCRPLGDSAKRPRPRVAPSTGRLLPVRMDIEVGS
jgi:gluconate 2-dehydrogenase subunit 3-like protein